MRRVVGDRARPEDWQQRNTVVGAIVARFIELFIGEERISASNLTQFSSNAARISRRGRRMLSS
jgi:hypothetical protein